MWKILLVLIGGGTGSVLRYAVSLAIGRHGETGFPSATLSVNLSGCLLIGILAGLNTGQPLNENLKLLLITGLLGGFTTFSAYSLETVQLFQHKQFLEGILYIVASNVLGILCAGIGFFLVAKF